MGRIPSGKFAGRIVLWPLRDIAWRDRSCVPHLVVLLLPRLGVRGPRLRGRLAPARYGRLRRDDAARVDRAVGVHGGARAPQLARRPPGRARGRGPPRARGLRGRPRGGRRPPAPPPPPGPPRRSPLLP